MEINGHGRQDQWITVEELLLRIGHAVSGMGDGNPNKALLWQCRATIVFLLEKVPDAALRYQETVRPAS